MARPAPSVDRTIQLLNFMSENPREQYSLTDIARQLDFNKATCHAMLSELVGAGVLLRHPTNKTYGLGPTLVTWGVASAFDAFGALEFAEHELDSLRQKLDVSSLAIGRVGDEIIILARRDTNRPIEAFLPVGHRVRCSPPFGSEFYAWASEEEIESWLARVEDPTPEAIDRHRKSLEEFRDRGYLLAISESRALSELTQQLQSGYGSKKMNQALLELNQLLQQRGWSSTQSGIVDAIIAPVFGRNGEVVLALSITGFAEPISVDDADKYVRPLLAATRRVTASLGGRRPTRRRTSTVVNPR